MKILKRFKNPIVLTATIANMCQILALVGFDIAALSTAQKIGSIVISTLLQVGVLSNTEEAGNNDRAKQQGGS